MVWLRVEGAAALAPGEKRAFEIDGREVLICRIDSTYFALANRCTHAAWPLAAEPLEGNEIVCTLHGARFDVRDGTPTGGPASKPLATFAVELREGEVYVKLASTQTES